MAVESTEEIRETIPNIESVSIEQEPKSDHLSEVEQYWQNWKIREEAKKEREINEGVSRKKYNHNSIIWNFFNSRDRQHYRRGSKVFFEGDTLYSYGHHFILAVKTKSGGFVINADVYSISTAGHTSIAISNAPKGTPQIPFTALERAHINVKDIIAIDKTADTYEERQVRDENGNIKTVEIHHLGACLFIHRGTFYLSSLDHASRGRQYFLVQLRQGADSVAEALKQISGLTKEDYEAYERGKIKRQGEYFFKPIETMELYELIKRYGFKPAFSQFVEKRVNLGERINHGTQTRNEHITRDFMQIPLVGFFARGTVRHSEHGMLKLGNIWNRITLNDVVNSWSATGRVD